MPANSQIGFAAESTYGTRVVPTRFLEFNEESLTLDRPRLESAGIRPGRRVVGSTQWKAGRKDITGDVNFEVKSKGFSLLFNHCFGTVAITTPGGGTLTRDHTHNLGTLPTSLTCQVGREDVGGTVRPFDYLGCRVQEWSFENSIDNLLMFSMGLVGRDEQTNQTLATAAYASGDEVFSFTEGALTIAAVSTPVRNFTMSGTNSLQADAYQLGSALRVRAPEISLREITGELDAEFSDLTAYNRFVNGTEAALVLTYTGALIEGALSFQVIITANVRFDGTTPTIPGQDEIRQPLAYKVMDTGVAATTFQVVYRTTDTAV